MEKEKLIEELKNTKTYDRENALVDLYVFLRSENETLNSKENTQLFIELSQWRDCSLSDGVESYYDKKEVNELIKLKRRAEYCFNQEIREKFIEGINTYNNQGDFSKIDEWIIENEWIINDFLVELANC